MTWTAIIASVVIGLVINEYADIAPWIARKIVRRAARRMYADNAERAETRAEEWSAVIEDRPGKLFKLGTALGYSLAAVWTSARRSQRVRSWTRFAILHGLALLATEMIVLRLVLRDWTSRRRSAVIAGAVLNVPPIAGIAFLALLLAIDEPAPGQVTWGRVVVALGFVLLGAAVTLVVMRLYLRGATAIVLMTLVPGNEHYRSLVTMGRARIARDIMGRRFL